MAIAKGVSEGQPLVGREGFVGVGERVLGCWTYLCWGESPWVLDLPLLGGKSLGTGSRGESPWALDSPLLEGKPLGFGFEKRFW